MDIGIVINLITLIVVFVFGIINICIKILELNK